MKTLTLEVFERRMKQIKRQVHVHYPGCRLSDVQINPHDYDDLVGAAGFEEPKYERKPMELSGTVVKAAHHVAHADVKVSVFRPGMTYCHTVKLYRVR